ELAVTGEELHLKTVWDSHRLDALLGREVFQLLRLRVILLWVAEPSRRHEQLTRCGVIGRGRGLALGYVPHAPVAHGGHRPNLGELAGEGFRVPCAPAAVD